MLEDALERQSYWHKQKKIATVEMEPFENKDLAIAASKLKGSTMLEWLDDL